MKKIYRTIILSLILIFFTTSCSEDEATIFTFTLACSDDLLEFVIPIVTFCDNQDIEQIVELSKDEFKTSVSGYDKKTVIFNGDSSSILYWQKRILINSINISRDMSVKYVRKEQHPDYSTKQYYWMAHDLYGAILVEVGNYRYYESNVNIVIGDNDNRNNSAFIKCEEMEEYLAILECDSDYCAKP